MTVPELRTALAALGLSQVRAALVLGINSRTMRRYCLGQSVIPEWLPLALRGIKCKQGPLSNSPCSYPEQ
jgi:hypothetical protein